MIRSYMSCFHASRRSNLMSVISSLPCCDRWKQSSKRSVVTRLTEGSPGAGVGVGDGATASAVVGSSVGAGVSAAGRLDAAAAAAGVVSLLIAFVFAGPLVVAAVLSLTGASLPLRANT